MAKCRLYITDQVVEPDDRHDCLLEGEVHEVTIHQYINTKRERPSNHVTRCVTADQIRAIDFVTAESR